MGKILGVVAILYLISGNALAYDHPMEKLKRGLVNVITSPVEEVKQVREAWILGSAKTMHISAWLFSGVVKGMVMTVARIGSGVWDIVSFPFALPADGEPLLKPGLVFEDWPKRIPGVVYKQFGDK